jgi:cytochrome c-type biogenesis protein
MLSRYTWQWRKDGGRLDAPGTHGVEREKALVDPNSVSVGLALIAGLVSFLSPCVLSLVPAYLAYLGSRAITPEGVVLGGRRETVLHGVAFVLGFGVVFVALGALAGLLGGALFEARDLVTKIGGIVVVLFGLHTLGIISIPFLEYDTRRARAPDRRWGYLSSSLMGVFFSAGWSPCIGPVLGAVLTLALAGDTLGRGVLLLAAYTLGLGIPFVLAAAGVARVSALLKRYGRYLRYLTVATGILLIVIGVLIFTNSLQSLSSLALLTSFQNALDDGVTRFWHWLTGA